MTDEQFKQLMAKLDEILQRLPAGPTYAGTAPAPHINPGQCYLCRGYHHANMMCPKLQPGSINTMQGH